MSNGNETYSVYKIICIGDACVGKTSFLTSYALGTFREDHESTIGVEFVSISFNLQTQE